MPNNRLMDNYGWVQNTSNLSTVRDTLELVPEYGILHLELREKIRQFRESNNNLPKRWTWDARCRIKAIHALGLVSLNRNIQGYNLISLGHKLKACSKSEVYHRRIRILTEEEIEVFKEGLLTNAPVVRVLDLLNNDRKNEHKGLSKYDVGMQLGFVGDVGFTHIDPYWVVNNGYSFSDKEGDADKWARTILSWLTQVGWVKKYGYKNISGKRLRIYTCCSEIESVLRYKASSIERHVPGEMLCSNHHSFPKLVQKRRYLILNALKENYKTLNELKETLSLNDIHSSGEICLFEIINLKNAGFRIEDNGGYYKLKDRISLDFKERSTDDPDSDINKVDMLIEEMVVKYNRSIPPKLVDHLIRFGYDGSKGTDFEGVVAEFFNFLGYEAEYLGQGRGRVADILVNYKHPTVYANSYAVIVDAKATSSRYSFPASDKRKMKEYIRTHGPQLLSAHIPRHAFSFVSSKFINDVKPHFKEIENETGLRGVAIPVLILLDLGDKICKREKRIDTLYDIFQTNDILSLN